MKRLTPLLAIRARCLDCSETTADIRECAYPECSLFPYRMAHLPAEGPRRPLKAIRAFCLDCCDGSAHEVKRCHPLDCPLREFRAGHNPRRARKGQNTSAPLPHAEPPSHVPIPVLAGHT
jgi:hypothetical protein